MPGRAVGSHGERDGGHAERDPHLSKASMVQLLHQQHEMSDRFISHMLTRNIADREDLVDQLFNSSEKRLARTLLLLRDMASRPNRSALCRRSHRRRCRKWLVRLDRG